MDKGTLTAVGGENGSESNPHILPVSDLGASWVVDNLMLKLINNGSRRVIGCFASCVKKRLPVFNARNAGFLCAVTVSSSICTAPVAAVSVPSTCAPPVLKNAGCPPASRQTLITLFSFLTRFDGDDKPDAWRDQLCNHPQSLQLTWVPALLRLPVCQTEDY